MIKKLTILTLSLFLLSCSSNNNEIEESFSNEFEKINEEKWWLQYNNSTLDRLIDEALSYNHSLLSLNYENRANTYYYSSVDRGYNGNYSGSFSSSKTKDLTTDTTNNNFSSSVSYDFTFDLWGKKTMQNEIDELDILQSKLNIFITSNNLVYDIVVAYYELVAIDSRIKIYESELPLLLDLLAIKKSSFDNGYTIRNEVDEAINRIDYVNFELAETLERREIILKEIQNLTGVTNIVDAFSQEIISETTFKVIDETDYNWIKDIPDIKIHKSIVQKSILNANIAKAEMYPDISFNIGASSTSSEISDIFNNPIAALGLTINLPFLEYFRLNDMVLYYKYLSLSEVENYKTSISESILNYENAINNYKSSTRKLNISKEKLKLFVDDRKNILNRYANGYESREALIESKLTIIQSEKDVLDNKKQKNIKHVNVCKLTYGRVC